jgi:flagellar protein FliJ
VKPFTMHAVLQYRRQLEKTAQQDMHQALAVEAQLQEAFFRAEEELAGLYDGLQQDKEQGTTVDRLLLFEHRIDVVKQQAEACRADLDKQQAQVARKRQQLVKASKDRKIMEKIQEQQNAAHARYVEKKELGLLDEIAVLSHERKHR